MRSYKFFQFLLCFFSLILINDTKAQYISVDTNNNDANQLLSQFLASGTGCISVSGAKITGWDQGGNFSYGYFDKNTSTFDIDKGIILSTGKAKSAEGPKNNPIQSFTGSGWSGDEDLDTEIKGYTVDATALEFDFVSTSSDQISFEYMFLSEEYRPGNCRYSDGLAFFIKKTGSADPYTNFARIPGTNKPVTVPNVNSSCAMGDPTYFGGFIGYNNGASSPTNFNGQTKVMSATASIELGVSYHIKIVIADEGNYQFDSAVFLKAGSFVGNKNLGPDLSLENGTALCISGSYTIDATPDPVLQGTSKAYVWYKDGTVIPGFAGNFPKYTVDYNNPGLYEVEILLDSGCKLKGKLRVDQQILPVIGTTVFNNLCDDDLDGNAEVYFNLYTQQIISNLSPDYSYNIKYFENAPANINNPDMTKAISNIQFSSSSKDIYLWVKPGNCTPTLTKVTFNRGALSVFDNAFSNKPIDVCDDELEGKKEIDMSSSFYINSLIPAGYDASLAFYKSENGAKNKDSKEYLANTKITLDQKNPNQTYYLRFHQSGLCDNVAKISFNFKQPKRSTVLKDTLICKGTTIDRDAGAGFSSYRWYDKADPLKTTISTLRQTPKLPAGDYIVELGLNDCVYSQEVKISEPTDLAINNALIEGHSVTVLAANGIPPYRFKLDEGSYQSSNVFENVPKGNHTVEVMDACGSLTRDFTIINAKNAITPNGDGVNDYIDYSDLITKAEPKFEVYDRYGVLVFKGDKDNNFTWNGKLNGRTLPTSSYWYILEWNESGNPQRVQNTGWILLKNRNQ